MRGDPSAYETLGLSPGADQATIERAYKSLIKRYHPDREGGDATRASAINEAYSHLRRSAGQPIRYTGAGTVAEAIYARGAAQLVRRRKRKSRLRPILFLLGAVLLYLRRDDLTDFARSGWAEIRTRTEPRVTEGRSATAASPRPIFLAAPVERRAISAAVQRAILLHANGGDEALADESRACYQQLTLEPTLERLDGCSAFDNAVLELQRRDPLQDDGRFGATAITSRQINAATLLSADYLEIDERLDRVRATVQSMLAPPPLETGETSDLAEVAP